MRKLGRRINIFQGGDGLLNIWSDCCLKWWHLRNCLIERAQCLPVGRALQEEHVLLNSQEAVKTLIEWTRHWAWEVRVEKSIGGRSFLWEVHLAILRACPWLSSELIPAFPLYNVHGPESYHTRSCGEDLWNYPSKAIESISIPQSAGRMFSGLFRF